MAVWLCSAEKLKARYAGLHPLIQPAPPNPWSGTTATPPIESLGWILIA